MVVPAATGSPAAVESCCSAGPGGHGGRGGGGGGGGGAAGGAGGPSISVYHNGSGGALSVSQRLADPCAIGSQRRRGGAGGSGGGAGERRCRGAWGAGGGDSRRRVGAGASGLALRGIWDNGARGAVMRRGAVWAGRTRGEIKHGFMLDVGRRGDRPDLDHRGGADRDQPHRAARSRASFRDSLDVDFGGGQRARGGGARSPARAMQAAGQDCYGATDLVGGHTQAYQETVSGFPTGRRSRVIIDCTSAVDGSGIRRDVTLVAPPAVRRTRGESPDRDRRRDQQHLPAGPGAADLRLAVRPRAVRSTVAACP